MLLYLTKATNAYQKRILFKYINGKKKKKEAEKKKKRKIRIIRYMIPIFTNHMRTMTNKIENKRFSVLSTLYDSTLTYKNKQFDRCPVCIRLRPPSIFTRFSRNRNQNNVWNSLSQIIWCCVTITCHYLLLR